MATTHAQPFELPEQAVLVVNDLMTARMQQFERVVATELPQLAEDFGLDDEQCRALDGWVLMMQDWMVGILTCHRLTLRYREEFVRGLPTHGGVIYCGRPSGLGTSAAELAERVRGLRDTAGAATPRATSSARRG